MRGPYGINIGVRTFSTKRLGGFQTRLWQIFFAIKIWKKHGNLTMNIWLVVWLRHQFFYFPRNIGNNSSSPKWRTHIFQRGSRLQTTIQSLDCTKWKLLPSPVGFLGRSWSQPITIVNIPRNHGFVQWDLLIYTYTYTYTYIYMSKRQNYCNTNLVFDAPWPFRGCIKPS